MHAPPSARLAPLLGWTTLDLVIALATALGFALVAAASVGVLHASGVELGERQAHLGGLPAVFVPLSLMGTLLAGLALYLLHRRRLPPATPNPQRRLVLKVVVFAVLLQATAAGFAALTEALGVPSAGSNLAIILEAYAAAPTATILAAVLVAPIGEELVFRRILLHRFAQGGRPGLGLVLTSLVFALIHEPLPGAAGALSWALTLATYIGMGLAFGALYLHTRRFAVVVAAHVLVNVGGIVLLLAQSA